MLTPVRLRFLLLITSVAVVLTITTAVIFYARGYRPDLNQSTIKPTGLLLAQSTPDGAAILLNNQLISATNTTLNLSPGDYTVEIKKDGFIPWQKKLKIVAEVVTRATPWLFPSVPSLKPITTSGAIQPILSPDGTKVAYLFPAKHQYDVYTLDLTESPLGLISRDPKKLTTYILPPTSLTWSPDSRQILVTATSSATLVDVSSSQTTDVSDRTSTVISGWHQIQTDKDSQKFQILPVKLQDILATTSANLIWSPNEKKIIYTATASATIPDQLINPLPGSSTQTQERTIKPRSIYVYDLEEDRNFLIDTVTLPSPTPKLKNTPKNLLPSAYFLLPNAGWSWFPSSFHLYKVDGNKIIIKEYDNQNPSIVYAGPMQSGFAGPYPSGKQLLILSNLNPDISPLPNLYAVSLR